MSVCVCRMIKERKKRKEKKRKNDRWIDKGEKMGKKRTSIFTQITRVLCEFGQLSFIGTLKRLKKIKKLK